MKIAYLLESSTLCGGVKVVFRQASAMIRRRHEVVIFSPDAYPEWMECSLPYIQTGRAGFEDLDQFDWVVGTTPRLALSLFAQLKDNKKLLHLVQGYEGDYSELCDMKDLIQKAYLLPIRKMTVSSRLARRLGKLFPGRAFHSIGQGLDRQWFHPRADLHARMSQPVDRVFLIGPLGISIKNLRQGLMAFELIKERFPRMMLFRVSTADTRAEEEALIGPIDAFYVGATPEQVGEILRSGCGIFMSPSGPGEGFGLPPLEAMACGVPTVLTDIPSYKAFSDPCDYARFVPQGDHEAMAHSVCDLIQNDEDRMRLVLRGLEVTADYTFEKVAEEMEMFLMRGNE